MALNYMNKHRMLRARQNGDDDDDGGLGGGIFQPPQTGTTTTTSSTRSPPTSTSSTTTSRRSTSTTTETPTTTTSSTTRTRPSTTSETETETSTTSTTATSSSIRSSETSSTAPSTTSSRTTAKPTATITQTSSFRAGIRTSATVGEGSTISESPSTTASPSGAVNTGALIGGIAGGLAVVALLAFLLAIFIRRWRNRRAAEEFEAAQFRKSAMVLDSNNPSRPPTMFQTRGHGVAPSISSTNGANMAGAGVYQQDYLQAQDPFQSYGATTQEQDAYDQAARAALQERPQYTYGEVYNAGAREPGNYEMEADDMMRGVYSAEPQMQTTYNATAYGDYHAYTPEHAVDYSAGAHATQAPVGGGRRANEDPYGGI